MINRDYEQLAFLSRRGNGITHALCRPGPVTFGKGGVGENAGHALRIFENLADREVLRAFFEVFLITQWLLYRPRLPEQWWERVLNGVPMAWRLGGLSPEMAAALPWRTAPVLITDGRICHLRHFVITALPAGVAVPAPWPEWADPLMTERTKSAIRDAATACADMPLKAPAAGIFCFPLAPPNGAAQIDGRSLGLPLALALLSAAADARLPSDVIATGAVSPGGAIEQVGLMAAKRRAAAGAGFSALLCPAENARFNDPPQGANGEPPAALPAADLRQAWVIARLYRRDRADQLIHFSRMARDPRALIDSVDTVDPEWLNWARRNGLARSATEAIGRSPALLAALTDRLERCARQSDTTRADAVAALLPAEIFDGPMDHAALSAFRWCAANLSNTNHRGRIAAANDWARRAEVFLPLAGRADIVAVTDYFNHAFVARHKRFCFQPEPPAAVRRFLNLLERQYAVQREFECPTFPPLGRLYGSISQNYGFCGPRYLDRMRDYSEKARLALGEGTAPEFKEEWLRQYNYLTYALLEAGDRQGAMAAFFAFAEAEGWEAALAALPGFSPWRHAAMARVLADLGGPAPAPYLDWCRRHLPQPPRMEHPWQLWCVNMGRVALDLGEAGDAAAWFIKGLAVCRYPEFGATVRMMTLLPLSGLHRLGRLDAATAAAETTRLRAAAAKLHPGYFDAALSAPLEETLADLWRRPESLFPFNYH